MSDNKRVLQQIEDGELKTEEWGNGKKAKWNENMECNNSDQVGVANLE